MSSAALADVVGQFDEMSTPLPAAADRTALPRTLRLVDKAPTTVELVASVSRVMNDESDML